MEVKFETLFSQSGMVGLSGNIFAISKLIILFYFKKNRVMKENEKKDIKDQNERKLNEENVQQNAAEELLANSEAENVEGGMNVDEEGDLQDEQLDLSEIESIEGGVIDKNKNENLKDDGSGGGIVCWC